MKRKPAASEAGWDSGSLFYGLRRHFARHGLATPYTLLVVLKPAR